MPERFVALLPRIAQGGAQDALAKATADRGGKSPNSKYGFGPVSGSEDEATMAVRFQYRTDVERRLSKDNPQWKTNPVIPAVLDVIFSTSYQVRLTLSGVLEARLPEQPNLSAEQRTFLLRELGSQLFHLAQWIHDALLRAGGYTTPHALEGQLALPPGAGQINARFTRSNVTLSLVKEPAGVLASRMLSVLDQLRQHSYSQRSQLEISVSNDLNGFWSATWFIFKRSFSEARYLAGAEEDIIQRRRTVVEEVLSGIVPLKELCDIRSSQVEKALAMANHSIDVDMLAFARKRIVLGRMFLRVGFVLAALAATAALLVTFDIIPRNFWWLVGLMILPALVLIRNGRGFHQDRGELLIPFGETVQGAKYVKP